MRSKTKKQYTGKNRIILIGPPTIGKTTISTELGKKLNLKVVSLDNIQASNKNKPSQN